MGEKAGCGAAESGLSIFYFIAFVSFFIIVDPVPLA